jgi:hypothetical protein
MTIVEELAQRYDALSRTEEDPNARAVYALAAATASAAAAVAYELRLLGVGSGGQPGAIEELAKAVGELGMGPR